MERGIRRRRCRTHTNPFAPLKFLLIRFFPHLFTFPLTTHLEPLQTVITIRNSIVLIIAGASAATVAAIPARASNAVTTEAPITAPQAAQAVQTPGKDSEIWYADTNQSEDAQSTEAVIIETDEEYEHVLKQAMAVSNLSLLLAEPTVPDVSCLNFVCTVL
jgi:hypothetical protein